MKLIKLEQSGDEWKSWRMNGLGASDVPIIMGTNPYKTPYQLWEEKCGFSDSQELSSAMIHGIKHEGMVRNGLNQDKELELIPICIEDDIYPFMKASLDGYDSYSGTLYEIKCPTSPKTIEKAMDGIIHEYWLDQVQWQIMICKPVKAYIALWDWDKVETIVVEVKENLSRQNEMREKAIEFWNYVKTGQEPPMGDKDYLEVKDEKLETLVYKYVDISREEKSLKEKKKKLKEQIIEFGDDGNFQAYGMKVKRCHPRISYDYEKMKSDGVDLNKYKKTTNSIGYYKIIVPR